MHPLVNFAIGAARRAGDLISRNLDRAGGVSVSEKSRNDFVTEIDHAAEQQVIAVIRKAYPHHGILAEESGRQGDDEYLEAYATFRRGLAGRNGERCEQATTAF